MRIYITFILLCCFCLSIAHQHDHSHDHDHHTHDHDQLHQHSSILINPFPKLTTLLTTTLRKSLSPLHELSTHQAAYTASIIVSSISLVSLLLLPFSSFMSSLLLPFAVGALLSDLINHLLPQIFFESHPFTSIILLTSIAFFSLFDALLHRYTTHSHDDHLHSTISLSTSSTAAYINLAADALHNFCDGITLAAAFLSSTTAGIATTIAIILHELPQELADFAILLRAGFSKPKALLANLLCAITALLGTAVALSATNIFDDAGSIAMPFAAGALIYMTFVAVLPDVIKDINKPIHHFIDGKHVQVKPTLITFFSRAFFAILSASAGVWLVGIVESLHEH